jgi:hypothetical protein
VSTAQKLAYRMNAVSLTRKSTCIYLSIIPFYLSHSHSYISTRLLCNYSINVFTKFFSLRFFTNHVQNHNFPSSNVKYLITTSKFILYPYIHLCRPNQATDFPPASRICCVSRRTVDKYTAKPLAVAENLRFSQPTIAKF